MPALLSSSIPAVLDRVAGLELPAPVASAPELAVVLSTLTDPRKRRGVRHGLVTLLSIAVCAVAAGARSFVAIAEWAADLPVEVAAAVGIGSTAPSESAVRRLVNGWIPIDSTRRSAPGSNRCCASRRRTGSVKRWR